MESKYKKRPKGSNPPNVHAAPLRRFMNISLEAYGEELISTYRTACMFVLFVEMMWIVWPILGSILYGAKAIFSWLMFIGVFVRIFMLILCASYEEHPERIGTTIFSEPNEACRKEQWFRWFGIMGLGRTHGNYSLFSKWVHPLVIIVVGLIQIYTRKNFSTDKFWLLNCTIGIVYIFYTYSLNWYFVIYGCVIPRETAVKDARSSFV